MKLTTVIPFLAVFLPLVSALPSLPWIGKRDIVPPPFLLKTVAVNGTKFDGLYVYPTHSFAGGNRPGVFAYSKNAVPSYLENTSLFFNFGKGKYNQYPFAVDPSDYAASWYECNINIGSKPTKKFYLDNRNYLITELFGKSKAVKKAYEKELQGAYWRVCKWAHGYPELFLNYPFASNNPHPTYVPDVCSLVNIEAVPKP